MKPMLGVIVEGEAGLAVAVGFASRGYQVVYVETSPERRKGLLEGNLPSTEEALLLGWKEMIQNGLLIVTGELSHLAQLSFVFIYVETDKLWQVVKSIVPYLTAGTGVVLKSTVPVGTGDEVQQWLVDRGHAIEVISSPEFLRQGSALADFQQPSRTVLGGEDCHPTLHSLRRLLAADRLPVLVTSRRNAEMIKYAETSFFATKLSFIYQLAQLCERLGAEVDTVAQAIGLDPRIGQGFMGAGMGVTDPSLAHDIQALILQASDQNVETPLFQAVRKMNEGQPKWMVNQVREKIVPLFGRTIAVWGIHPDTALPTLTQLLQEGMNLHLYAPVQWEALKQEGIEERFSDQLFYFDSPWETLEGADALTIMAELQEFRELDLTRVKKMMRDPLVIDGWNLYPTVLMKGLGFEYVSVGRKI
ncbi:nucleotide sugar dehydrogenase [Ammoniphilus resinae]|uniref:UDP-glucose 6-dehydrogenase n=1 Tax=Ammoniphilus resinae TaxID=861532 RepID=A0ABS4GQ75_9BACL|nr:nucleotide sugar dehydrogenase [Ammoniphilus resinae]MBP1932423.1 UDPglucose 6-dehydrogenase [Ammoniphilus resinae]